MTQGRLRVHSLSLARRKRRLIILQIIGFFLLPFIIAGLIIFLFHIERFRIENVYVEGDAALSPNEISAKVKELISGDYLHLFPKDNVLLYPRSQLVSTLSSDFKGLASVAISLKDLQTLAIIITERIPHALWCGEKAAESAPTSCYFLDEDGYIFSKAPHFSGNVFFRYYGALASPEPIGTQFIDPSRFKTLEFLMSSLSRERFTAVAVALKPLGIYEAYLEEVGRLIFNDKQNFADVVPNLKTLTESDAFKAKLSESSSNIDYIDLEYGNKIFYKFK